MLGIHRLTTDRAAYYLNDLAQELPPPTTPDPGWGSWAGQAARGLGLQGPVDPAQFRAVLDGRHPLHGHSMRSDRVKVLGVDLTFSAPKSASVVMALGGPDVAATVVAAHSDAVRGAVTYLEGHGITATRRQGVTRPVVPTTGLVAATFTHGVNRNGDPHLHSHVVMTNLVQGQDGRWSACDGRGIVAHRQAAGAVYDAHLRHELSHRLGVVWTQAPQRPAEIRGVSPHLLGEFSSRSADIRRHLAEVGASSSRSKHIAWAVTRSPKSLDHRFTALTQDWARRAGAHGIEHAKLVGVLGQRGVTRPSFNEHHYASVLSVAPDGGARRRDVVAAFGAAARDGAPAATLAHACDLWVPPASLSGVGVAEVVYQRRHLVPSGPVLRTLGPRPVDAADHEVWRDAARTMVDYRLRWGVTDADRAMGLSADRRELSSFPTPRLVDHLRTEHLIDSARMRLGRSEPRVMEMDRGR